MGTIEEARGLAVQLRESAGPGPASDEAKAAIELRDGLFVLLRRRMRIVRRAAEFVFQEQPEIVKELASAYDRRRRGRNRAVAEAAGVVEPTEA